MNMFILITPGFVVVGYGGMYHRKHDTLPLRQPNPVCTRLYGTTVLGLEKPLKYGIVGVVVIYT
jgi:hypothetical protein